MTHKEELSTSSGSTLLKRRIKRLIQSNVLINVTLIYKNILKFIELLIIILNKKHIERESWFIPYPNIRGTILKLKKKFLYQFCGVYQYC